MSELDPRPYLDLVRPSLVPIARPQNGVCRTCRSGANSGWEDCYQCANIGVVEVLPISMSKSGGPLDHRLRLYKRGNEQQRIDYSLQLGALLGLFLRRHMNCIGGSPDAVVTVCSPSRDAPREIIRRLRSLRDLHVPLVWTGDDRSQPRYSAPSDLEERRVLLVDDTFTSGRTISAAHKALTEVGANVMTPVVLGRYIRPSFSTSPPLLQCLGEHRWKLKRCGICDPISCPDIAPQGALL